MDIIITEWALQSYLDLKHKRVFTKDEYYQYIRPDVELLREGFPSPHPKFNNGKFWGPATLDTKVVPHGYKMKWHQIGPGRVQLRLGVGMFDQAFLCRGYVKSDEKVDKREVARLKIHLRNIFLGQYSYRGAL